MYELNLREKMKFELKAKYFVDSGLIWLLSKISKKIAAAFFSHFSILKLNDTQFTYLNICNGVNLLVKSLVY